MRTIVILQARQGSSRLPGKSMMMIRGRPMLRYTIDSILQAVVPGDVYLATSTNPENDPLRQLADSCGIKCCSGDETDVASRYVEILEREPDACYFLRVCGDSPLYDYRILQRGIDLAAGDPHLQVITSLPNRGYPQGMNLEMIECSAFLSGYSLFSSPPEFEHVTQYFYARLQAYRHRLVHCDLPNYLYERYKFSVDTKEEFDRMSAVIGSLSRPTHEYALDELCRILDATPAPRPAKKEAV